MEKRFKLKEHGTTVRTEVMAGITTFMAMAYILMVNAGMFASLGTVSYGAIYIATAISAVIGLFIAFIGLQNAGIVVDDGATLVNLASFNVFTGSATWASIFPMLITLVAVFVIGALSKKKVKGAVL